jgi:hypothetical protein
MTTMARKRKQASGGRQPPDPNVERASSSQPASPPETGDGDSSADDESSGQTAQDLEAGQQPTLDQLRERVANGLTGLLRDEQQMRDRLQVLDARIKPLQQKIHQIKERVALDGPEVQRLREKAATEAEGTAKRIGRLTAGMEWDWMRCREFLLSMAQQVRRHDALVTVPAEGWTTVVEQQTQEIETKQLEVLEWITTGEERYSGTTATAGTATTGTATTGTAPDPQTRDET